MSTNKAAAKPPAASRPLNAEQMSQVDKLVTKKLDQQVEKIADKTAKKLKKMSVSENRRSGQGKEEEEEDSETESDEDGSVISGSSSDGTGTGSGSSSGTGSGSNSGSSSEDSEPEARKSYKKKWDRKDWLIRWFDN